MKDLVLSYELVPIPSKDSDLRLEKAFDIIFSKIKKDADLGSEIPQNPVRAEAVSANV